MNPEGHEDDVNHEGHEGHEGFLVRAFVFFVVLYVFVSSTTGRAQDRFEAGAQIVAVQSGEFDANDIGIGGRFSWQATDLVGAEAEMNVYPRAFPASRSTSFSGRRIEGLFGVTAGPRFAHLRPFAKLRPGFVRFGRQSIACILIFPPPLACQLAAGRTVFALDVGGGIELFAGPRTFIRVDAGDRLMKYPGPSFRDGRVAQDDFFSHDFRMSAGVGVRF
jgi:hypothetical protein